MQHALLILNNHDTKSRNFTSFIKETIFFRNSGFLPDGNILVTFLLKKISVVSNNIAAIFTQHFVRISHFGTCAYDRLRCKQMFCYMIYSHFCPVTASQIAQR